jgi:hypothetical protein
VLVVGFFDSDDAVARFDHKVATAYRWPVNTSSQHLTKAGFTEVQQLGTSFRNGQTGSTPPSSPERPDEI